MFSFSSTPLTIKYAIIMPTFSKEKALSNDYSTIIKISSFPEIRKKSFALLLFLFSETLTDYSNYQEIIFHYLGNVFRNLGML
ncbi:hypothetical protein BME96_13230 [Virgibacillus halodenitrificans]|uniref:Uncharacterized protein n=1 Tax=Virgibacillus halodenitrificans TaxID=1482 RepID=A0AAC9J1T0_VIRHA|nr:hypothetical protein BME96_13230 [Virgibacillus halodenitrificans]